MSTKKKAAPKKAPKKRTVAQGIGTYEIPNKPDENFLGYVQWGNFTGVTKPRLRIGSIVRYKDGDVMIVLWRDEAESERKNVPYPKQRYSWVGIHVSDPNYGWDTMYVSDKMLEDGEVEIIGHFDFFGLVNGNQNR